MSLGLGLGIGIRKRKLSADVRTLRDLLAQPGVQAVKPSMVTSGRATTALSVLVPGKTLAIGEVDTAPINLGGVVLDFFAGFGATTNLCNATLVADGGAFDSAFSTLPDGRPSHRWRMVAGTARYPRAQNSALTPGGQYTERIWLRNLTGTGVDLSLSAWTGSAWIVGPRIDHLITGEWQHFQMTFTAGAATSIQGIGIRCDGTNDTSVEIGGFQLVQGPLCGPPVDPSTVRGADDLLATFPTQISGAGTLAAIPALYRTDTSVARWGVAYGPGNIERTLAVTSGNAANRMTALTGNLGIDYDRPAATTQGVTEAIEHAWSVGSSSMRLNGIQVATGGAGTLHDQAWLNLCRSTGGDELHGATALIYFPFQLTADQSKALGSLGGKVIAWAA